jgi:hypothetical protein
MCAYAQAAFCSVPDVIDRATLDGVDGDMSSSRFHPNRVLPVQILQAAHRMDLVPILPYFGLMQSAVRGLLSFLS